MKHAQFDDPMMESARALIAESNAFPTGSPDWAWRRAAAWKLDQMARKVPACDWTEAPPNGLLTKEERAAQ